MEHATFVVAAEAQDSPTFLLFPLQKPLFAKVQPKPNFASKCHRQQMMINYLCGGGGGISWQGVSDRFCERENMDWKEVRFFWSSCSHHFVCCLEKGFNIAMVHSITQNFAQMQKVTQMAKFCRILTHCYLEEKEKEGRME